MSMSRTPLPTWRNPENNQVEITRASFFDFGSFFKIMEAPITTIDAIANIGITKRRPTSNAKNIIEAGTNKARIANTKPIKPINNPTFILSNVIFKTPFYSFVSSYIYEGRYI